MRLVISLALICLTAIPAWAGTITLDVGGTPLTITTTVRQDAAIQRATDAYNARARVDETPLSPEQFLRLLLVNAVRSYIRELVESDIKDACAAWTNLPQAQQNSIKALLGGKSPCK